MCKSQLTVQDASYRVNAPVNSSGEREKWRFQGIWEYLPHSHLIAPVIFLFELPRILHLRSLLLHFYAFLLNFLLFPFFQRLLGTIHMGIFSIVSEFSEFWWDCPIFKVFCVCGFCLIFFGMVRFYKALICILQWNQVSILGIFLGVCENSGRNLLILWEGEGCSFGILGQSRGWKGRIMFHEAFSGSSLWHILGFVCLSLFNWNN